MINISEKNQKSLYYDLPECLEFCKKIESKSYEEFTLYHMFWNVGFPFERKQTLPIKSYLATQNLEKTKLIVWSNISLLDNEYFKQFSTIVENRIYNPIEEAKDTKLEGRLDILNASDERNWTKGDLFRILILHKYGGVYVDFDVVFLRDFSPLLKQEFMYKWGLEKNMINGAIMRMYQNSLLTNQLINEIENGSILPNTINWSSDLYQKVRTYNEEWTIFPSCFFNSEWQDMKFNNSQSNQTFQPFLKNDYDMYDGTFAWHWHNKWTSNIEEGSKWHFIENKINKLLKEKNI